MAQKPISNRIGFGQNLNPLRDYAGVPPLMTMEMYKHSLIKLIN